MVTPLYPLFLKLDGRKVVVVGGGEIAWQKAGEFLECGAALEVISPDLVPGFHPLVDEGRILWRARRWQSGDAEGAAVVLSATADPEVDKEVYDESKAAGALVNVVDVVDRCDFYAGAVVRRGPVRVAISTAGTSPSLAIAVRERIEQVLPERLGDLAGAFGEVRGGLLKRHPDFRARARRLGTALRVAFGRLDAETTTAQCRAWAQVALHCERACDNAQTCCLARTEEEVGTCV